MKEFVRCINTTNKETILKGWENTLAEGFDYDEGVFAIENNEEEPLWSEIETLMIENGKDDGTEDSEDEVEMIQNQPAVEQPTKTSRVK